jgi:hypothetical protein
VVHRKAGAALGLGFAAAGFERRVASAAAVWQRPAGPEFAVGWVQPTRSPDAFGWYGSRFIIEFRRGGQPRAGVLGPGLRFCQLLDDRGGSGCEPSRTRSSGGCRLRPRGRSASSTTRDEYLAQGKQVTAAYSPDHDVWFRYRDERDLDAWFRLLPVLLPGVLEAVRLRLG